jgi:glycosyltransferase involved in cell wall biosynthesis
LKNPSSQHIAYVALNYDVSIDSPEQLLSEYYTIHRTLKELVNFKIEVSVVQLFNKDCAFKKDGIQYYFIDDGGKGSLGVLSKNGKVLQKLKKIKADVIHLHNLRQLRMNREIAKFSNAKVIVQNHGEEPFKWGEYFQKYFLSKIDRFLFAAEGQEKSWLKKGIIKSKKVRFVMEGSSYIEEGKAKRASIDEQQNFIWTGNLDKNKDPLTVLSALNDIFQRLANPNLDMIYKNEQLLLEVKSYIEESPGLKNRVNLIGYIDQRDLEEYYKKAHYFVQGSAKEGSGFSILEAMSVGTVPIITDIPSFRKLTDNGKVGALFQHGSSRSFIDKSSELIFDKDWKKESVRTHDYFQNNFSFSKIASNLLDIYQER